MTTIPPMTRLLSAALLLGMLAAAGCGGSGVKVTGRVTCQDKPVVGLIQFSPREGTPGASTSVPLKEDGTYEIELKHPGKYTVVVTPNNVALRPKEIGRASCRERECSRGGGGG